jgi:type II secretory ATPase GspE/PulE/Tfp pilus assembly ATPase PilB-like protein
VTVGAGCEECNGSGFKGRMGFFEVIRINSALRSAIAENRPVLELRRILGPDFVTMRVDGIEKAALGLTTVEEVLRATQDVDDALE